MNLTERRKELRLTLKDVADAVGVSAATVSRWESGEISNLRRDKIELLANLLRISPLDILGFENEPDVLKERAKAIIDGMDDETVRAFIVMYGKK